METLYTRKQLAAILKVSPKTIYVLEKKGSIEPRLRINGRPRYSHQSLKELLKEAQYGSNSF